MEKCIIGNNVIIFKRIKAYVYTIWPHHSKGDALVKEADKCVHHEARQRGR